MLLRKLFLSLKDPALKVRWIAFIDEKSLPDGIFVEAINPGFIRTGQLPRFYGGMSVEFPEFSAFEAIQISLYEDTHYNVTKFLQDWRLKVFEPDKGEYGLPSEYMRTITVQMMPVDMSDPIMTLKLSRCWPADQQAFELSYQEVDGRIIVTSTISIAALDIERPNTSTSNNANR